MRSVPLPKSRVGRAAALGLATSAIVAGGVTFATADSGDGGAVTGGGVIKHVVVLFQENTSFDHYFGTYPNAANKPGEVQFTAAPGTPSVDGLTPALLTANPNAGNPKRLGPGDVVPTIGCDNTHAYTPEQLAFDGGKMDKFVENTTGAASAGCAGSEVMNYYDGNTVTGLWNYAQHFAMSDNSHGAGFGPSTIGAIQLISGNTATAAKADGSQALLPTLAGAVDNGTAYSNANPPTVYDKCSGSTEYAMDAGGAKNIGDLLTAQHVSWGWFQGGFTPTSSSGGNPTCGAAHTNVAGASQADYDPHHNPFAYYQSTSNPSHLAPTDGIPIGDPDPAGANHQYDDTIFDAAAKAGTLPAVSFVKAPKYQDGHPGNSDPIDEQTYLVNKINELEASPDWSSTAIFIAWDDSDGWYDHKPAVILRGSTSNEDALTGAGTCGALPGDPAPLHTDTTDRCGPGPRLPLLLISPYAKTNYVDHTQTDQSSILRFIEANWSIPAGSIAGSAAVDAGSLDGMFDFTNGGSTPKLVLDPSTGALPGAVRVPTPTPVPTATPVPVSGGGTAPVPTATPAPVTKPVPVIPGLGKLTCTGKLSGSKKIVISCTAKKSVTPSTNVRARVYLKKTLLGTASATVKKTKVTITVKTKKAVKHGKYTLTLSIATAGATATAQTGTLKL